LPEPNLLPVPLPAPVPPPGPAPLQGLVPWSAWVPGPLPQLGVRPELRPALRSLPFSLLPSAPTPARLRRPSTLAGSPPQGRAPPNRARAPAARPKFLERGGGGG